MQFYLATGNKDKLREFRQILGDSVTAVPVDVEENGSTFEKNALIKARAVWVHPPFEVFADAMHHAGAGVAIADDSGLCVEALDGAPGVHSARWAEPGHRKERLLRELAGIANRRATFVTAIAAVFPDGTEFTVRGECFGVIADAKRGDNGFGYDPVFIPDEFPDKTMAEIYSEQKNQISHRAKAILALKSRLGL